MSERNELADWRALNIAYMTGQSIWPNNWCQNVSTFAFMVRNLMLSAAPQPKDQKVPMSEWMEAQYELNELRAEVVRLNTRPSPEGVGDAEMSPEFTDTSRAALAWVLYHHQGGNSPIGQPIRFALGMGQHDPLSDYQIREAKRWADISEAKTADFHVAPAPQEQDSREVGCEGGAPDCGPVAHHDSEGVPLCQQCWDALISDSATAPGIGGEQVEGYQPIERDDAMDRDYIPMPGGWEVQTKGGGSTYRICGPEGARLAIPDSPYLHETLTRMARDVNAAWAALSAPERVDEKWPARYFASGPDGEFFTNNHAFAEATIKSMGFERDEWTITDLSIGDTCTAAMRNEHE